MQENVSSPRKLPCLCDLVSPINVPFTLRIDTKGAPVVDVIQAIIRICGDSCIAGVHECATHQIKITLKTAEQFNTILQQGLLKCGDIECHVQRAGSDRVTVTLENVVSEISNEVVSAALEPYGKVHSVDLEMQTYGSVGPFNNGNRKVIMDMVQPVPKHLIIARHMAEVTYPGVVIICERCHLQGHFAAKCKTIWCKNCGASAHMEKDCKVPCKRCKDPAHRLSQCTVRSYVDLLQRQASPAQAPAEEYNGEAAKNESPASEGASIQYLSKKKEKTHVSTIPTQDAPQMVLLPVEKKILATTKRQTSAESSNDVTLATTKRLKSTLVVLPTVRYIEDPPADEPDPLLTTSHNGSPLPSDPPMFSILEMDLALSSTDEDED